MDRKVADDMVTEHYWEMEREAFLHPISDCMLALMLNGRYSQYSSFVLINIAGDMDFYSSFFQELILPSLPPSARLMHFEHPMSGWRTFMHERAILSKEVL
ncbi:hypothetical protein TNCV_3001291 [Trichonephila clavipes]|nr:hypothetical protein TNCV_3001291 [Trichonephila clavipes]